ncbi:hypothetical protein CHS0354_018513 [Potamilus streckersoni]|uniref:Tetratricopeptide repeat protein n=1 Tax=Potamilus streckersoni TaxID=2493646 RepID=A0AAE0WAZ0_9BIVA|nr:hypothetical protein CHS0354_018513 [Potamilus streckersoni]
MPATQKETEDFGLIRSFYEKGFIRESLDEIKAFRSLYPGSFYDEDLRFYEAVLIMNLGDKHKGLERLTEFLKIYPTGKYQEDAVFYKAAAEADLKRPDDALLTIVAFESAFPKSEYLPQIQYYKVKAGFYKEDWEYTKRSLEKIRTDKLNEDQKADIVYIRTWTELQGVPPEKTKSFITAVAGSNEYSDAQKRLIIYRAGLQHADAGQYNDAVSYYDLALKYTPKDEPLYREIHFQKGSAYYAAGISLSRRTNAEKSDAPPANNPDELKGPAGKSTPETAEEKAVNTFYQKSLEAHAVNLDEEEPFDKSAGLYQTARIHFLQKEYETARATAEKLTDKELPSATAPETLKKCAQVVREASGLLASKSDKVNAYRDELHTYKGYCYLSDKKYLESAAAYGAVRTESDYYAGNLPNYLTALKNAGNTEKYNTVLKGTDLPAGKGGGDSAALLYRRKMELLLEEKKWDDAGKLSAQMQKSGIPGYEISYYNALILQGRNKPADAEKELEKAYRETPSAKKEQKLKVSQGLAEMYRVRKKYREQVAVYNEIIPLIDDDVLKSRVELYVAGVYVKNLNRPEEALPRYEQLFKTGRYPYNVEAGLEAADIYLKKNNIKSAQVMLERLVKQDLKKTNYYPLVTYKLGAVYHYKEDYKKALFYYRETAQAAPKSDEGKEASDRAKKIADYVKSK